MERFLCRSGGGRHTAAGTMSGTSDALTVPADSEVRASSRSARSPHGRLATVGQSSLSGSRLQRCPLCAAHFHVALLESHAARCQGPAAPALAPVQALRPAAAAAAGGAGRGHAAPATATAPAPSPAPAPCDGVATEAAAAGDLKVEGHPAHAAAAVGEGSARGRTRRRGIAGSASSLLGPLRNSLPHDRPRKQSRRTLSMQSFEHLVVLDFEWTCDDRRPMLPVSEIS